MTKSESELDDFGKQALQPLQPAPSLDPQVLAQDRAKFLQHADQLRSAMLAGDSKSRSTATGDDRPTLRRIFSLPLYKVLAVLLLVLALVAGSSFSVFAAQSSLPGDPLYNIKSASEDLRLSLTTSTEDKLSLTLNYTDRRISELQTLVSDGKTLPDQTSDRYQQELEEALQLAAQLDDQQMQAALGKIKILAEKQGMTVEELILRLPAQAQPAIVRLQERLREQVQLSSFGEQNPQEFRNQVHARVHYRQGPKNPPASEQPGSAPMQSTATSMPPQKDKGNGNGQNQPTKEPGKGNSGNGQGQNSPGNGNHNSNPTHSP